MRTRRNNDFTTVKVEGAILPADVLKRIADGDAALGGLEENSYHLTSGEKVNEAVSASWNRLLGRWTNYKGAVAKLPEGVPATTETRERWLLPLFQELGYGRLIAARKAVEIQGKTYPISHFWNNVPLHLVGSGISIDKAQARVPGAARTSPHGLVQEFLNRTEDHLWAFVSNGKRLRILRDNSDLVRQAFVEFDLESMMDGEVYSDFVLLWLLCHQSRVEAEKPTDFWLEKWSYAAQEKGIRALDSLRKGVEEAITSLGKGFLAHRANRNLRDRLKSGELDKQDYYRQLLRLVYRLLFLIVAEDRRLLLDPNADERARERYTNHYSTAKLRRLAGRRYGSRHPDLYVALGLVMEKLGSDTGYSELGLPALGGFLFSKAALSNLEGCEIANHDLLNAVRALAFTDDRGVRRQVDYKNLGSEELGSVYESLLELHPELNVDAATFLLSTTSGNERKTTGSYYTPASLINSLLDSALEPVLDAATKQNDPEAALLNLKVCDPACGSGHVLVAAGHRIAKRLAQVRTRDAEPSPEAVRHALRNVVGRCIYGVDINPMAVELCKVSLWMEAVEPGKPLSFLDHHILCGNSLIGTTPTLIQKGIPDEAFKPIEGDDPEYCREYKRRNRDERRGQRFLPDVEHGPWRRLGNLAASLMSIDEIDDDTIEGVHKRQERYENLVNSSGYRYGGLLSDAWCAAFVWKKRKSEDLPYPITEEEFRRIEESPFNIPKWMEQEIKRLAAQYRFFHWHLAFPGVFREPGGEKPQNEQTGWSGGFDAVLGNPPWEKIQIEEQSFFASKNELIARSSARTRKRLIEELRISDPFLFTEWNEHKRRVTAIDSLFKNTGRFPLTGVGKLNTYALFAELDISISVPYGKVGCVLPIGLVTDEGSSQLFGYLVTNRLLVSVIGFENESLIFPTVHHSFKFCLLILTGKASPTKAINLVFFCRNIDEANDPTRRYTLSADDFIRLNPNTLTCPIFRSAREAELVRSVYKQFPVISSVREATSWPVRIQRILNSTDDVELFEVIEAIPDRHHRIIKEDLTTLEPVYEAKMFHQFDHRFGTYVGQTEAQANQGKLPELTPVEHADPDYFAQPRWWAETQTGDSRTRDLFPRNWVIAFRDITSPVVQRTAIAAVLPHFCTTETCRCVFFEREPHIEFAVTFISIFNSFVFDFVCRTKFSGNHLSTFVVKQLPMPQPDVIESLLVKLLLPPSWIHSRVLELTFTAWDLKAFAEDSGYDGPPFIWNEGRRHLLRCELDATYFHLFSINRDDVDYIMETFPIVKRKDEQQHGEYRTKRVILEIYDEMAQAISGGEPYQTRLNPPPADPRVAHAPRIQPVPFVLPTGIRYPQPDEGIYAMRVILSMLQASGGSIDVQRLMNACSLLVMPDMLERHAVVTEGSLAHEWRQRFSDTFNPELFLPKLDDLVQRGEIKLLRQGKSFIVTRIGSSILVTDADIELDTRLALRVADSLSPAEKEAITPMATQQEIEARFRVA
jgi:hypothetical protein